MGRLHRLAGRGTGTERLSGRWPLEYHWQAGPARHCPGRRQDIDPNRKTGGRTGRDSCGRSTPSTARPLN
eukprot:4269821-Lingulodinium_polyedra.AAC.1